MNEIQTVKKRVLAFDIDNTLGPPRAPISGAMADLLKKALERFDICIISGRRFDQFKVQLLDRLESLDPTLLMRLHCFPAQGTQYYRYCSGDWEKIYAYSLSQDETEKIFAVVKTVVQELGYWAELKDTQLIENYGSQITYSAFGSSPEAQIRYDWDPDLKKRTKIIRRCKKLAPEFDFKIGGATSIDIVLAGMDKGFGMRHALEELGVEKNEVLFFGDMTTPEGNDYPIVKMGIDTITVKNSEDTAYALKGIIGVLAPTWVNY